MKTITLLYVLLINWHNYTDKDRGSYINLVMAHFPATKLKRHALAISTADSLAMHENSMAYKDKLSSNGMLSMELQDWTDRDIRP